MSLDAFRALLVDEAENGVMPPERRAALLGLLEAELRLTSTVAAQRTRLKAAGEAFDELAAFLDYALPGDPHVSMLRVALPPAAPTGELPHAPASSPEQAGRNTP